MLVIASINHQSSSCYNYISDFLPLLLHCLRRDELHRVLQSKELDNVPLLVFGNKSDRLDALPANILAKRLQLDVSITSCLHTSNLMVLMYIDHPR